jgi:hypothetical protein
MVLKVVFNSFRIIFVEEKLGQREETGGGWGKRGWTQSSCTQIMALQGGCTGSHALGDVSTLQDTSTTQVWTGAVASLGSEGHLFPSTTLPNGGFNADTKT